MAYIHEDIPDDLGKRDFSIARKGYDKDDVHTYLMKVDAKIRDLTLRVQDSKIRLEQSEYEVQKAKSEQGQSVDTAIAAVLDAKDRILERARKQAEQIELDALDSAKADLAEPSVAAEQIVNDAHKEAKTILDAAQLDAAELINGATETDGSLGDLTKERDQLVAQIAEFENGRDLEQSSESKKQLKAAEARATEIIISAEAAADSIRGRLEAEVADASSATTEAREEAEKILADAEERAQTLIALADEASGSSRSEATEHTLTLISGASDEAEKLLAEANETARALVDEANSLSESTKDEAEQLLKNAVAAAEARSAEIVVREAELEQLAAMASTAEEEAATTLESARDGADALRLEAQELRDEASRKRDEAQALVDETKTNADSQADEDATAREKLDHDAKEMEASIVIMKAEAAEIEDASLDASGLLEALGAEIAQEEQRLAAAKTAVEAELEDLKVDMADLRSEAEREIETLKSDVEIQEASADDATAAGAETAAQIVGEAEERAAVIDAEIESRVAEAKELAAAAGASATESALSDARDEADSVLAAAKAEADRMEAAAAEILRQATEESTDHDDASDVEAMLASVMAREFEVDRRERDLAATEQTAGPMAFSSVPETTAVGSDGWPEGPSSDEQSSESDSIDAIRREAMAALDESRLSDDWVSGEPESNGATGDANWDYGPSVPHQPKPSTVEEATEEQEDAQVESRYRRNSAKLPRIGIEPGSSADSISNLRKKIVND